MTARIAAARQEAQATITVRASSWASLFDCAYRWEGEHIMGMRKPAGLRAHLGTSIHAGTALFDSGRLPGADKVTIDDAASVFVSTLRNPDREVDFSKDDLTVKEAEVVGLKLTTEYCSVVSPQFKFHSVEQKLAPLDIDCGGGVTVRLTGTMDRARVAMHPGAVEINDLKSGSTVIQKGEVVLKGKAPQIGTYQLMFEATEQVETTGGRIVALKTSGRPEVAVSKAWDAKPVMLGTEEAPGLIEHAANMFRTGMFPPNPTSILCGEKYCARWARCPYHE